MTDKIVEQIFTIRDSAVTNVFDVNLVQREANDRQFYELVLFLASNRDEYAQFIMTGKR